MNLARILIEKPLFAWIIAMSALLGGIVGYLNIGRLEDPNFTIKTALVIATYPGANAQEVELEVTDRLESSIQQMEQIDRLESRSMPGFSEIRVHIRDRYVSSELPQIWDELRNKVGDTTFPPGVNYQVMDSFGDVYGMFYAITGEGYSPAQIYDYARELRRQLLMIDDVADIVIAGQQQEQITVEVDQTNLIANNLSLDDLAQALHLQNEIQPAGRERVGDFLVRIKPTPAADSVEAIRALPVGMSAGPLTLGDIAHVYHGYAPIPNQFIRSDGQFALTIGISARSRVNVVKVGAEVAARMKELEASRPKGMELHVLYDQPYVVEQSVRGFVSELMLSVVVVGVALCFGLGWRAGAILAIELFLSVLGTVAVMYMTGIELQRMSLGALIIVMGMLTDNSIVVCEGMLARVAKGMSHIQAAGEILEQSKWILLASTIVGILAFSGIGLSPDAVGEFCESLFTVAAISLLISWVVAIGLTPLLGKYLLRQPQKEQGILYDSPMYRYYGHVLRLATRRRIIVIMLLIGVTLMGVWGMRFVGQGFFPASTTPLFYVNMHLPRGADIRAAIERSKDVEALLLEQEGIENVSTYIGGGATRFFLVYDPETRDPSYAQFIVRVKDVRDIPRMLPVLDKKLTERFYWARWVLIHPEFGPGGGPKIQLRISGPNPVVLRELSQKVQQVLRDDGGMIAISDDREQPVNAVRTLFDDARARPLGVTRRHLSNTFAYGTDGVLSGLYREGDKLLPIVVRSPDSDPGIERLTDMQVFSLTLRHYVPVGSVIDGQEMTIEEGRIMRRDRDRTLTVKADPDYGQNSMAAFWRIRPTVEAISPPEGYRFEWGGQYESSRDAKESLYRQLPMGFIGMILLVLLMFGRLKPALVVLLVVPMSICGVTLGLLLFNGSFGFIALLGLLSLFGMLIKNAVMVVQEIDDQIAANVPRQKALIEGSMSRLRPVGLAAGTTILGMAPLLLDPFFYDMAITMMAGLAFATVLTLVAVPTLYAAFFSIRESEWNEIGKDG